MGIVRALFSIFLISELAFSAATPLEKLVNSSFEPDQAVTGDYLSVPGYLIIISDGNETYIVQAATAKKITGREDIVAMLSSDVKNTSGYDSLLASVVSSPQAIAAAKNASEAQCMLLTGTNMHNCTGKQTCIYACKANPNCDILLYSDGFWEALLDWSLSRVKFAEKLAEYSSGLEQAGQFPAVASGKEAILSEMISLSNDMTGNVLFLDKYDLGCNSTLRCYEYCPKINYAKARMEQEKSHLASLRAIALELEGQGARADRIISSGAANDAYLSTRKTRFEQFRVSMTSETRKLSAEIAKLEEKVDDEGASNQSIASLSALSDQIEGQAASGLYRAALARQGEWESKLGKAKSDMQAMASSHAALISRISSLWEKVNKSKRIIGNESVAFYSEQLANSSKLAESRPTQSNISSEMAHLEFLSDQLTEEIAEKATEPAPQGPAQAIAQAAAPIAAAAKQQLPCLPGFVLLSTALFAVSRPGAKRFCP